MGQKTTNLDENDMTKNEIIIDGSEGEGGGQVLRTSLSLYPPSQVNPFGLKMSVDGGRNLACFDST